MSLLQTIMARSVSKFMLYKGNKVIHCILQAIPDKLHVGGGQLLDLK